MLARLVRTGTGKRPGRPRDPGGVVAPKPRGRGARPIDDPGGVAAPGPHTCMFKRGSILPVEV